MNEEKWQPARLIPISGLGGQDEKERRATSALLAVLGAVKEFRKAVLAILGAPAGVPLTFCEVPFELDDGRKVRVDGVIRARRGKRAWTFLVEVKTGTAELTQKQVEAYLDAAREQGFNGLLTISNQIVAIAGHHPVKVDKRKIGRLELLHLSWTRILTLAHMAKEHDGVSDPDQAWILGELIRYLEYEGSGALAFDDMGPHWVAVRTGAKEETLQLSDAGVEETAARWDQLIQFLCLRLGARLGEEVRPVLTRKELREPDNRTASVARELAHTGTLSAAIRIPNAVGPIHLKAHLRGMIAQASVEIDAPTNFKRPSARLNWLLRQLQDAPPDVRIDLTFAHTSATSSDLLGRVIEKPRHILANKKSPRSFVLTLSQAVGTKRKAGRGGFITDTSALLDRFYRDVVQGLTEWTPPAPQLSPSRDTEEEISMNLP